MKLIKWADKVTNGRNSSTYRRKEDDSKVYSMLKSQLYCHILKINCLVHDAIEGQITEVKGEGIRRRTKQLLDDLRNKKRY